jgi:NTP pyrophosphatase (non-canonical NTP hydrolase)
MFALQDIDLALKRRRKSMTFEDYEKFALSTADYPNQGKNLVYPALGLIGESGEYADKIKKYWRNTGYMTVVSMSLEQRLAAAQELGDPLWYIAASARELRYTLQEIVDINVAKLSDRRARGVIRGEGDNR